MLEQVVSEPLTRSMANMFSIKVHNKMHTGVLKFSIIDIADIISQGEKDELRYL